MARVATAYVEVRPDLKGFGTALRTELKAVQTKIAPVKARVEVDGKGAVAAAKATSKAVSDEVEKGTKDAATQRIGQEKQYFAISQNLARANQKTRETIAKAGIDHEKNLYSVSQNLAKYNAKVKADIDAAAEKKRTDDQKAAADREKQFFAIGQGLAKYNAKVKADIDADADKKRADSQKAALDKEKNLFAVSQNLATYSAKVKADADIASRKRIEQYAKDSQARIRAQFFADEKARLDYRKRYEDYVKRATAQNLAMELRRAREVRKAFSTLADAIGGRSLATAMTGSVIRALGAVAGAATRYAPRIFRGITAAAPKAFSQLGDFAGKAMTAVGKEMASSAANAAGQVAETVEGVVASAGEATAKIGGKVAANIAGTTSSVVASSVQMTAASAATTAEITAETGGIGGLVVAMLALVGGMAVVTVGAGLVQVALGGILAVVIPLIAGITALVASFAALGSVIVVGGLATLPAVIGAAVAAFGPLMVVAEEFQKLFENTSKHVGALYVVMQRLKNGIFAVISSGFIQAIKGFVTNTLPLFVTGIVAVASAWNRLLLGLVRLASMPAVVAGLNTMFRMGAQLVDFFAQSIMIVAPALLTMATVAGPAFAQILDSVSGLVTYFGVWVTQLAASGQMATFFADIANIFGQILGLATILVPLTTGWMRLLIGPAGQFLGLLTGMVTQWTLFVNSAAGASLISGFFTAMNQIMVTLVPLINQIFVRFLEFGPVLANLNATAVPALQSIVDILFNLLTQITPGIMQFLQTFANNLQDPRTQAQLRLIGDAIVRVMKAFGAEQNLQAFLVALRTAITLVQMLVYAADVLEVMFVSAINTMIDGLNKFNDLVNAAVIVYNQTIGRVAGPLNTLGDIAHLKLNLVANAAGAMGTTSVNAFQQAANAATSFANANAWDAMAGNIALITAQLAALKELQKKDPSIKNSLALVQGGLALLRAKAAAQAAIQHATSPGIGGGGTGTFWGGYNAPVPTEIATGAGKKAGKQTAAGFISTFIPAISKLSTYDLVQGWRTKTINSVREVATYMAKGVTSGTKNIQKVSNYLVKYYGRDLQNVLNQTKAFYVTVRKYRAAVPSLYKNMAGFKNMDQITNYLSNQRSYWEGRLQDIKDFKANVKNVLTAKSTMVGVFGFIPTPQEVKSELDQQLATMKTFMTQLNTLRDMNLDKSLYRAWLEAGPEQAGNIVAGLQTATQADIDEINAKYKTLGTTADRAVQEAADKYFPLGQKTIEGYIAGIKSMQSQLSKAITAAMKQAYADAKKAIKAKSPSQLYAGLGVNSMTGYISGVASKAGAVATSVADVLTQAAGVRGPALSPGTFSSPMFAGSGIGQPTPPVFNVRVYIGDRDITDIVRVEHQRLDENQARVLLAGRRGG